MSWEQLFRQKILLEPALSGDPAHDLSHFDRVAKTARKLCEEEGANWNVILPAAWLHDFVNVPKDDPRRAQASRLSAQAAVEYLREIKYPSQYFPEIQHAIEAHSFSAKISPETLEAKIVQDADRLDAVGAIGIARCFTVGGKLNRKLYHPTQPFVENREFDDLSFTLDHFFVKLFQIVQQLHTSAGRKEGQRRAAAMQIFLDQLKSEVCELQSS